LMLLRFSKAEIQVTYADLLYLPKTYLGQEWVRSNYYIDENLPQIL
jgi:hypothetical protein